MTEDLDKSLQECEEWLADPGNEGLPAVIRDLVVATRDWVLELRSLAVGESVAGVGAGSHVVTTAGLFGA